MRTVTLGEICSPKQWHAMPKSRMMTKGYPVYGANGVIGYAAEYTHDKPTILVGCRGTIGTVHISEPQSFATGNTMALDGLRADLVDMEYLARFLQWRGLADVTSGSSQPQLTRAGLIRVEVPLPPVAEQRRLAAILGQADVLRGKRRIVLSYLANLTQSIFLQMFGDPTCEGPDRHSLAEIGEIITGNTPSRTNPANYGDGIEWIKSDNLGGTIATTAEERLSLIGQQAARVVPTGSILVTCIAGSPLSIGKASLVDRKVAFNQQINAVVPGPSVDVRFLLEQFKVAPNLVRQQSTGGMKGLVSKSNFSSIKVLVPPLALQRHFAELANEVDQIREREAAALAETDRLYRSLDARAFTGRL